MDHLEGQWSGAEERFGKTVGEALRRSRQARGLSLRRVASESDFYFQPSTLGGYERGERAISLVRFCELARLYRVPPDQLLSEVLHRMDPDARREVRIDLHRLFLLPDEPRRVLGQLIEKVRGQREDFRSDVITLRQGDLEAVTSILEGGPRVVLERIRPAIRDGNGG